MSGSAICVLAIVVTIQAGNYSTPVAQAVLALGIFGVAALPALAAATHATFSPPRSSRRSET